MLATRSVFRVLCVLILGSLVSCSADRDSPTRKSPSTAFSRPETTTLGKAAAAMAEGHDGDSGFLLLDRGRDALSWRTILTDAAEKSIDAQYFLWKDDAAGEVFMQHLMAAADRGVRVRLLVDDSMTESDPLYLATFDAYPNVEVRLYKPFGPKRRSTVLRWIDYAADLKVLNHRMHNKMFIADSSIAIIGGRNIANEYFEYPGPFIFRSRDLLALGPVLNHAGTAFDLYWNSDWAVPIGDSVVPVPTRADALEQRRKLDAVAADPTSYPDGFFGRSIAFDDAMTRLTPQLLWGRGRLLVDAVPEKDGHEQTHAELDRTGVVLGRIAAEATDDVFVQSAYLILLPESMKQLAAMAARGVEVRLSTNSMASDNHLSAFVGYRKQRQQLLEAGATVYEMRPDAVGEKAQFTERQLEEYSTSFGLHAKTMVFDEKVTFVGSFNLDPRSVNLNTEMGLLVEGEPLAHAVADSIRGDLSAGNSWQVVLGDRGTVQWITTEDGVVTFSTETEPMTSAEQRAEADALAVVPDDSQM